MALPAIPSQIAKSWSERVGDLATWRVLSFGMNLRRLLAVAGLAVVGVLLAGQVRQLLADPTIWPPDDFVEYWAAAKLTLNGENPYDPAKLLPLQQSAGRDTDEAIMMWNPPWSLAVVLPLGLLQAREAQLLWLLVNLAAMGYCGDRLWTRFGGNRDSRWIGWAAAVLFLPPMFASTSTAAGSPTGTRRWCATPIWPRPRRCAAPW